MHKSEKNIPTSKIRDLTEEEEVQIFAKQMLAKRMFIGHYQERRHVEALKSYRDVIRLSDSEEELKRDLDIVKSRVATFYLPDNIWIGITGPQVVGAPSGHCIWVKLNDLPFGHYWFQIRDVKFTENNEISLRIKVIRSLKSDVSFTNYSTAQPNDLNADVSSSESNSASSGEWSLDETVHRLVSLVKEYKYDELARKILTQCSSLVSLQNVKEVVTFLFIFIVALVTGYLHFLRYLGDFTLRFMREISILIRACTPVLLGIIDFFSKCVGGFYILIAMWWRGGPPPQGMFQKRAALPAPRIYPSNARFRYPGSHSQFTNAR